jgi:hypothetical protein
MKNTKEKSGVLPVSVYNSYKQAQWREDWDKAPYDNKPQLAFYLFFSQRTGEPLKTGYVAWNGNRSVVGKTKKEAQEKLGTFN